MKSWKAILVDDEPPARQRLRKMLNIYPEIEITGEASDVKEALQIISQNSVNLVFLDMNLGSTSGFDLLPHLDDHIEVVFVTAYDQFALRAFEVHALDYLLKPVTSERLRVTLQRLQGRPADGISRTKDPKPNGALVSGDPILLRTSRRCRLVTQPEISHLQAEGSYSVVHLTEGESEIICRTLAEWSIHLPAEVFARLDRSTIVNKAHVRQLRRISRGESYLLLSNGKEIPLGRTGTERAAALIKGESLP